MLCTGAWHRRRLKALKMLQLDFCVFKSQSYQGYAHTTTTRLPLWNCTIIKLTVECRYTHKLFHTNGIHGHSVHVAVFEILSWNVGNSAIAAYKKPKYQWIFIAKQSDCSNDTQGLIGSSLLKDSIGGIVVILIKEALYRHKKRYLSSFFFWRSRCCNIHNMRKINGKHIVFFFAQAHMAM